MLSSTLLKKLDFGSSFVWAVKGEDCRLVDKNSYKTVLGVPLRRAAIKVSEELSGLGYVIDDRKLKELS